MKSLFPKILFLLALFAICIFFYTCRKNPDCSACELTNEEAALIFYNVGDIVIFKNDQTGEIDTLRVETKRFPRSGCAGGCYDVPSTVAAGFTSAHLGTPSVLFWHSGSNFGIRYYSPSYFDYYYPSYQPMQSVTIDTITYTDVFPFAIDSSKITGAAMTYIPWKVDYSRSEGFLRFHLKNGITWSKQ